MGEKPEESGNKPAARAPGEEPKKSSRAWGGRRASKRPIIQQTKFEGKCIELKGSIYDASDTRQADIFAKTTKEIAEYVGHTYKYGSDTRLSIENMEKTVIPEPTDPPTTATKTQTRIWERQVDEYVRRSSGLDENLKTLYSLIWGQCTTVMQARIESRRTRTDERTRQLHQASQGNQGLGFQLSETKVLPTCHS